MSKMTRQEQAHEIRSNPYHVTTTKHGISVEPVLPEQLSIFFETTGSKGGDGGHGGVADLIISGQPAYFEISDYEGPMGWTGVKIRVRGDWELSGLAAALVLLGQQIALQGFHLR